MSAPAAQLPPPPKFGPGQSASIKVAATVTNSAKTPEAIPVDIKTAPANYGVYVADHGELKPLGSTQTKVQIGKFRSLLRSYIPFVRQKIDINIPGAHSTSRFESTRPTFFAYFPPSRDVSNSSCCSASSLVRSSISAPWRTPPLCSARSRTKTRSGATSAPPA